MADLRPHIADEYRVRGWAAAPVTASYGATLYGSIFSRSSGRARYGRFRPKTQKITPRGAHRWPVAHGWMPKIYLETLSAIYNTWYVKWLCFCSISVAYSGCAGGAGGRGWSRGAEGPGTSMGTEDRAEGVYAGLGVRVMSIKELLAKQG